MGRLPFVNRAINGLARPAPETAKPPWGTSRTIFDHAEELAGRFEEYQPGEGDERPVEEYLLQRAVLTRARSKHQIVDAVVAVRAAEISWKKIGDILGMSAQAAQQWYGGLVEHV